LAPDCPRKFSKSEKIGAKFVRTTSKKRVEKILPYHFTLYIVDVHPHKNISLAHYGVPRKTVKFVPVVPKAHGRATFVRTERLLSRAFFKNFLEAFYRRWFAVM